MTNINAMSSPEVISALGLEYLEGEGVGIRLLWRTDHGNAVYGFLTPDDFSALHLLDEDVMWVQVAGAPVDMLALHPDGSYSKPALGTDLDAAHSASET